MITDTGPFTGHQKMSDVWFKFRDFVRDSDDLPVGFLVKAGCKRELPDDVDRGLRSALPEPRVEGRARARFRL